MLNTLINTYEAVPLLRKEESKEVMPVPVTACIWELIRKRGLYHSLCITNKCNMSCNLCFMYDNQNRSCVQEMNKEDIGYILKMIGTREKVILSGGEPTLKEDLFSIIDMINKSDNIPMLFTNGIKLADQDYVSKLAASGIRKIYLSLDGLEPRTTEVICGDSRYLDLKLKALDNLKEAGKIKICIAPRIAYGVNESEIGNFLNLIREDRTHTIKSIMFIAATRNPGTRYHLPPDTATTTDYLIKNIEDVTDGVLSKEYFSEFTRLRENLDMYLNKFRAGIPLSHNRVLVRRVNNKLKQFVDVSELKDMNFLLENKNFIGFFRYVYKYRQWFKLIRYIYSPNLLEFAFYNIDEIIFIEVVPIADEPLRTLEKRGIMHLVKGKSDFHLYATGPT